MPEERQLEANGVTADLVGVKMTWKVLTIVIGAIVFGVAVSNVSGIPQRISTAFGLSPSPQQTTIRESPDAVEMRAEILSQLKTLNKTTDSMQRSIDRLTDRLDTAHTDIEVLKAFRDKEK